MALVIINADDFGMSSNVCRAIIELLELGAISNTTIMVAAPGSQGRARQWGARYLYGVAGLHLQLTGGRPISPPSDIPSLIDPGSGNFLPRDAVKQADPVDVEREWVRQLEVATELLGGLPTHLDSHHGVHRLPNCSDVYLSLASELNIPVRGGGNREFEVKVKSANVRSSTKLIRDWTGHNLGPLALIESLKEMAIGVKDSDLIEVVTHPGFEDDYITSVSGLSDTARNGDRMALKALAANHWLASNGFFLVAYPKFSLPVGKRAVEKWRQLKL